MKTLIEEEQDFLYEFAITDRKNLKSVLKGCTENQVRALLECTLNIKIFTCCKYIIRSSEKLRQELKKSDGNWKLVFLKNPERIRRLVARVIRKVILAEIILLLCQCS